MFRDKMTDPESLFILESGATLSSDFCENPSNNSSLRARNN